MLAWTMDIKQLVVEINSTAAACALWDTTSDGEDIYPIIKDCKKMLTRDWIVQIHFEPLSKNKVLQKLTSLGLNDPRELIIFPDPPFAVMQLLLEDYRLMIYENRAIILPQENQTIIAETRSEREEARLHHNKPVLWTLPRKGWCKLNAHASHVNDINHYAIGGVIKDDNVLWLKGYSGPSGTSTMFTADLTGIKEGLLLASAMDIKRLFIESNSTGAVCALLDLDDESVALYPIIDDCRKLLHRDWKVKISFQPMSTNKVAYKLARMGHDESGQLIIFEAPPAAAMAVLLDDYRLLASLRK